MSVRSTIASYRDNDLDLMARRLRSARSRAQSDALVKPLDRVLAAYEARHKLAVQAQERLAVLSDEISPSNAFQFAKGMLKDFSDMTGLLEKTTVPIVLDSIPSGAKVYWRGVDLKQKTPLIVTLPLRGSRKVTLKAKGFHELKETLDLEKLKKPRVVLRLGSLPGEMR